MERITLLLSERALNDSALHQTPFEKSLRRRLLKVGAVLDLIERETEYTYSSVLSSPDELRRHIQLYEELDVELAHLVSQYIESSLIRRRLFRGDELSIKRIAYSIKTNVSKSRSLEKTDLVDIKAIYATIFAQNPLAPPFDLARPFFERDLDAFNLSYQVLLDNFKLLVAKGFKLDLFSGGLPYSLSTVEALISKAEDLGREVFALIQKVFVRYEERLLVFEQIKESCNAICNRSRFLLGSHHPVYKEILLSSMRSCRFVS
jgi:hypothetical protein